jgi:hypothetical protein
MGIFDQIAESGFKTDAEGKEYYFPGGVFEKGYILPDSLTKERIMKLQKRFSVIAMITLIIGYILLIGFNASIYAKILSFVIYLAFFILLHKMRIGKITRDLETTQKRYTFKERIRDIISLFGKRLTGK